MSDKNTLEDLARRIAALEELLTHQSLALEELSQQMQQENLGPRDNPLNPVR